jgi:hypothetical protein
VKFTPSNIFDWRDRQYRAAHGYLTFRLYSDGWMVRFTPYEYDTTAEAAQFSETREGLDVYSACAFANDRDAS